MHHHVDTSQWLFLLFSDDAIVAGIRAQLPPGHPMTFTGLAMANIDSTDMLTEWSTYFLDARNHIPGTPVDWIR